MGNKATAVSQRIYEDFEPFCKWHGCNTVEIHLSGFKKEHLNVQTNNNLGMVTIHGERHLKDTNGNTWSRFHKEIKFSDKCHPDAVRAKLNSAGVLTVTMPDTADEFKGQNISISISLKESMKDGKDVAVKLVAVIAVIVSLGFGAYFVKYCN